jgi:hypothetical protein
VTPRAFRQNEPDSSPRPGVPEQPEDTGSGTGGEAGAPGQPWLEELLTSRSAAEPEEKRNLYCFVCGEVITSEEHRLTLHGATEYTFTNPGGFAYTIGCFREARGCEEAGAFTEAFSWFPGYAWRYAFCASCRVHLGWVYQGPQQTPGRFFGLISDRLVGSREGFPSTS